MNGHDILLIEDTSKHKNNAVWAYHMATHMHVVGPDALFLCLEVSSPMRRMS